MFESFQQSEEKTKNEVNKEETGGIKNKVKKWVRPIFLTAVVGSSSLVTTGCDKTPSPENEKSGEQNTKQVETEGHHHTEQEEKAALQHAFQMIAGNRVDTMPNGNIVLHIGGSNYYELDNHTLDILMKNTDYYLDRMSRLGSADPEQRSMVQESYDIQLRLTVSDKIKTLGKKIPNAELPKSLQESEQYRQQLKETFDDKNKSTLPSGKITSEDGM